MSFFSKLGTAGGALLGHSIGGIPGAVAGGIFGHRLGGRATVPPPAVGGFQGQPGAPNAQGIMGGMLGRMGGVPGVPGAPPPTPGGLPGINGGGLAQLLKMWQSRQGAPGGTVQGQPGAMPGQPGGTPMTGYAMQRQWDQAHGRGPQGPPPPPSAFAPPAPPELGMPGPMRRTPWMPQ